jgi:hypothetical protein
MPFKVEHLKNGCRVVDIKTHREFSKNVLPCGVARKQQIAIALSESRKTGKPVREYMA